MIDKYKSAFLEEVLELLGGLESSLLCLESSPGDEEISAVFRTMHSIKGSAAMFGYQHISSFTHEVETVFDLVRSGTLRMSSELVDLTLKAADHIKLLLGEGEPVSGSTAAVSSQIIAGFRGIVRPEDDGAADPPVPQREAASAADVPPCGRDRCFIYRVLFRPAASIMHNGTNPLRLLEELAALGESSRIPVVKAIPRLSELVCSDTYVCWEIVLTSSVSREALLDVFIFIEDQSGLDIRVVDDLSEVDDEHYKRLGEILVERGILTPERLESSLREQKKLGQLLIEQGVEREAVRTALEEQKHVRRARLKMLAERSATSVRIGSDKLDSLVDLVGELVTLQARLTQVASESGDGQMIALAESSERLIDDLRDTTMSMRMLPIGALFNRFHRVVRDMSAELGKQVEILTEGGETELDKTVIERLNEPLVHIIRNCLDHGIESPEKRAALNKSAGGTIRLSAAHSGASVVITVEDDGAGIDLARIREKAVERGLIAPNQELDERETANLVFLPGFSTAANVTEVSGRGVGMDVVLKEIESLGGSVEIESEAHRFTRLILKIPLTLAIIDGLRVELGAGNYIIPLSSVLECLEVRNQARQEKSGIMNNRGEILPYVRMREAFCVPGPPPEVEQIVVVNTHNGKVGLTVDRVVGDHQTVIKNLGKLFTKVEGVSGATILGDGSVALIVDVQKIVACGVNART